MYEEHWKLDTKPFEPHGEESFYYPGESHQGVLLKLRYAVENRRNAALSVGPAGSGKTMLIDRLRQQLPSTFGPVVHLVFPQMSVRELLSYLAQSLSKSSEPPGLSHGEDSLFDSTWAVDRSVQQMEQFLDHNVGQGRHAVVALDDVQLLEECGTLETVRLLFNLAPRSQPAWTLLLVGQPSILPALERFPALDERLTIKTLLRAFSEEETVSYVNHRLTAAGAQKPIFEPNALQSLHQLTQGSVRQINRLGDLVLLVGYAEERKSITVEFVETVSRELVVAVPGSQQTDFDSPIAVF